MVWWFVCGVVAGGEDGGAAHHDYDVNDYDVNDHDFNHHRNDCVVVVADRCLSPLI